jgi:ethanolamine transporter
LSNEIIKNITNIYVFTDSIKNFTSNLNITNSLMFIMMIFMVVGGIDRIRGNKLGYGEKFEAGFYMIGPTAIALVGMITLAPVLSMLLRPIITPFFVLFGASPAMFPGAILASDLGAFPMAVQLSGGDISVANFSGALLGTMMGPTISFTIPVGLSMIKPSDRQYFASGILVGLITIPVGMIAGGLTMNLVGIEISINKIFLNLIPIIIVSLLIILGIWFYPAKMMQGFVIFGKILMAIITIGVILAVFQFQTTIRLPLFDLMVEPDSEGVVPLIYALQIAGLIGIILIGTLPMVEFINRRLSKQFMHLGKMFGFDEASSSGLIASMANVLAVFPLFEHMTPKGKILNTAFAVSSLSVFGDFLGYISSVSPSMVVPMIVGKLVAAITALVLANVLSPVLLEKANTNLQDGQYYLNA